MNGGASKWTTLAGQEPQGSINLWTGSFPCIYDVDEGVTGMITKFADDTKVANTVVSNKQVKEMQNNRGRKHDK